MMMVTMRTQTFFLFLDWLILHSIGLISRDDGDDAHANFFLFQKKSTRPKSKRAQVVQRCAAWAWLLHDADWSARIGTSTLRRAECPRKDKLYPSRLRRKDAPAAIINLRCSHVAAICDLGNLSGSRPCLAQYHSHAGSVICLYTIGLASCPVVLGQRWRVLHDGDHEMLGLPVQLLAARLVPNLVLHARSLVGQLASD